MKVTITDVNWNGLGTYLAANLSSRTARQTLTRIQRLNRYGAIDSQQSLWDYYVAQKRQGLTQAGLNKITQSARHYCHYTGLDWELPKRKKEHTGIRKVYSDEEILAILGLAREPYKSFLYLLAYCGGRPNEVLQVSPNDFDQINNTVALPVTKDDEDRLIPLPTDFFKQFSLSVLPFKFDLASSNNELKRCCALLTIPYRSQYSLRHSFATRLRSNGADLGDVSLLLGHSDPKITMLYDKVNLDRLRKTIRRDTLYRATMTPDEKVREVAKLLEELKNSFKLDSDEALDLEFSQGKDGVEFKLRPKTSTNPKQLSDASETPKK